jgi:hypothetical protein
MSATSCVNGRRTSMEASSPNIDRGLQPALALFNINHRPIRKLARNVAMTRSSVVKLVPGFNPSHFDVGVQFHRDNLMGFAECPGNPTMCRIVCDLEAGQGSVWSCLHPPPRERILPDAGRPPARGPGPGLTPGPAGHRARAGNLVADGRSTQPAAGPGSPDSYSARIVSRPTFASKVQGAAANSLAKRFRL